MSVTQKNVASPPISPQDQIRAHLEHNGQKIKWLAGKVEVTKGHLGNILHGRKKLTDEIREKINTTLQTNY
jgi:plasmid maintenance system antidote protein VapI